ncbi:hypothetical protein GW17_00003994 [Ensete ventricosum]|nr:hypothetical protein GW17_00003994 [Ensete ventricosum]
MKPSCTSYAPPSTSSAGVAMHPPPTAAAGAVVEAPGFPHPYYLHPHPHPHPHPHSHHHQPHPAPPPAPPVVYSKPEQQRIKTLFVSGLPDDVKPREIHNLFRRRPGFDSCQLEYTGRGDQVAAFAPLFVWGFDASRFFGVRSPYFVAYRVVAFATFFNHQSAIAAMSSLDIIWLFVDIGVGAYTVIDKRVKVTNDDQELFSDDGNGMFNCLNEGTIVIPDGADGTFNVSYQTEFRSYFNIRFKYIF